MGGPKMTQLLQRAGIVVAVLLASLPPQGAMAWIFSGPGKDKLSEQHGRYVLSRGFGDLYDSAFVLTNAGNAAPRVVSVSELADALLGYDVVIFGEIHGHPGVHPQELRLLRSLYERNPRWILSFEQFERDVQGVSTKAQVTRDDTMAESIVSALQQLLGDALGKLGNEVG